MASFLEEMATYLDEQNAELIYTLEASRNVFKGVLPPDPDTCVALIGASPQTLGQNRDVAELQFPKFQVITRSDDYEEAADLMALVRATFHGKIGLSLTSYRVLRCHAEQEGGPIGQDDQGRHEFSCNFIAEHHAL